MKTKLDINALIQKAEELVHDGKIELAAEGEAPVQILEADGGKKYQLSVKMTLLSPKGQQPEKSVREQLREIWSPK